MPTVIITLTDTPAGGVAVHSDFRPAIGAKCSLAQSAALDIISRTKRHYGLDDPLATAPGINIDAVHLSRATAGAAS